MMPRPLVEKTTDAILNYIQVHQLQPGDKLPNEYDLAEDLKVGRSTLREAVRSLVSRNILEVKQGSGTYVSSHRGVVDDPLGFQLVENTAQLTSDLFALRYILEPEVCMLAAINRSPDQLADLSATRIRIEESLGQGDEIHLNLDVEFHSIIAEMSGNIAMDHIIPVINESIHLYNSYYTNDESKAETIKMHREIEEAIRLAQPFEAKAAMQIHLANNQRHLFDQQRKAKD